MKQVTELDEIRQQPARKRVAVPEFFGPGPCNNKRNVSDIDEWIRITRTLATDARQRTTKQ